MMLCALVPLESSQIELLPPSATPAEVLEKGPVLCVDCFHGWKIYWTAGSYHLKEVNDSASSLAKQVVKGDACLVHPNFQQHVLDDLLQSRLWRRIGAKQLSSLRLQHCKHARDQHYVEHQRPSVCGSLQRLHSSCVDSSSSQSLLKRARSCQRIAAANSTRQRIISGMNRLKGGVQPEQQQRQLSSQAAAAVLPSFRSKHHSSDISSDWHEKIASGDDNVDLTPSDSPKRIWRLHDPPSPAGYRQQTLGVDRDDGAVAAAKHPGSGGLNQQRPSLGLRHSTLAAAAGIPSSALSGVTCARSHVINSTTTFSISDSSSVQEQTVCATDVAYSATRPGTDTGACQPHQHTVKQHIPARSASAGVASHSSTTSEHNSVSFPKPSHGQPLAERSATPAAPAATSRPVTWDELPQDIVGHMACLLGKLVSDIAPVYLTCRSWRRAVLENDELLADMSFCLDVARPFKACGGPQPPVAIWQHTAVRHHHPALLERAAKLSNLSALVTRARLLEAVGAAADAMRLWRRAAKCGGVEAQLMYGLALYRGSAGIAADSEDAHIWLSKALKQVQKINSTNINGSGSSSITDTSLANYTIASSGISTPIILNDDTSPCCYNTRAGDRSTGSVDTAAVTGGLSARVQSQAGLVLGYLCFDGEGTRSDRQEAVRYFKLSAAAGWGRESREAAQVLGWIWNTGQY